MGACFLNVSKNQVPFGDDEITYSSRVTFLILDCLNATVSNDVLLVSEWVSEWVLILFIKLFFAID